MFVFRGRRGDPIKIIWWDGQGACLFSKRLEKGRLVWPSAKKGKIALTPDGTWVCRFSIWLAWAEQYKNIIDWQAASHYIRYRRSKGGKP